MIVFETIIDYMQDIFQTLNRYTIANAPIGIILLAFVLTSMVASVFWRGAKG